MVKKSDLSERIRLALENPGERPWLPDLTIDLVKAGQQDLFYKAGLPASQYGTARVISSDPAAPRHVVANFSGVSATGMPDVAIQVEILDESFQRPYQKAGISFYTAEELSRENLISGVEEALCRLNLVPTLATTVFALVSSLHLIKPEDKDFDVSFSEPHLPFSIFVSVHRERSPADALRVAEAIVHEAMHLQLSLIEQIVPLVNSTNGKYFSPWRGEYRTIRGVLHALYVFRVIDCFLEHFLFIQSLRAKKLEHIRRRRREISKQIKEIQSFQGCPELTATGAVFVQKLL